MFQTSLWKLLPNNAYELFAFEPWKWSVEVVLVSAMDWQVVSDFVPFAASSSSAHC